MTICSVTITSDTKATAIGEALRSVLPWVDQCLIVHLVSGDIPDNTLEVARQIAGEAVLQKWAIKNITEAIKARETFTQKGK